MHLIAPKILHNLYFSLLLGIECFHMTSRRPYWCPKTMKWRPCWCPKPVLWELNSFLMQMLSFVSINLHRCWPREWKHSIKAVSKEIENNAYAKFWGANKLHYGRYAIGEFREHKAREIVCKQGMVALFLLSIGRWEGHKKQERKYHKEQEDRRAQTGHSFIYIAVKRSGFFLSIFSGTLLTREKMFKIHGKCDYFHFFFSFFSKSRATKNNKIKTSCPCKVSKTSPLFQFSNNKRAEL